MRTFVLVLGPGMSVDVQMCVSYNDRREGTRPLSPRVVRDSEGAGEVKVEERNRGGVEVRVVKRHRAAKRGT